MQQKIDLIHEIHAMLAVPVSQQPKVIDFTSTGGFGFLSEMSVAEVCVCENSKWCDGYWGNEKTVMCGCLKTRSLFDSGNCCMLSSSQL